MDLKDLKELLELLEGAEGADAFVSAINKNAEAKGVNDSEKDGNFIPKSRFQEVIDQKNNYKTQADKLNKQLGDMAKANKGNEELQAQFAELQSKLTEAEVTNKKISTIAAIREAALTFKAKDPEDVLHLINQEGLELDEKGKMKGLKEQFEALQKTKPYLFGEDTLAGRKPHPTGAGTTNVTKEQFSNMGYSERVNLLNSNPDLYNSLK